MTREKAETGNLEQWLSRVGAGLDEFLKFEYPDAQVNRKSWQSRLDIPLPQQGIGIDAVTRELLEQVVPHGSQIAKPGFTGYIVTGGATASTLASAAASIASPARYTPTAFNLIEDMSLTWLAQLCGLANMQGIYSSGGSVANLVALGGARQSAFEKNWAGSRPRRR